MSEYKYPYVPKEYYPAVMFACKIIRQNGTFNKAINSSAKYYGVDPVVLTKYVRARQGAGQRGRKRAPYKWYAIAYRIAGDIYTDFDPFLESDFKTAPSYEVLKATRYRNAREQLRLRHDQYRANRFAFVVKYKECESEIEARNQCQAWYEETQGKEQNNAND